jgi:hypothetical protein
MVDGGDIGGLAGILAGAYFSAKAVGAAGLAYSGLGAAYVAGTTILAMYAGHALGHQLDNDLKPGSAHH